MNSPAVAEAWSALADTYRDRPGEEMFPCAGGCGWSSIGPAWARADQCRRHWFSCPSVLTLTFHPDGALASVTFKR